MPSAAEAYAALIDAGEAQRARRRGTRPEADRWSAGAARFRQDPHRELDAGLHAIAAYLEPADVLLDIGGGAGRVSLPLASRCREVVNVEPSAGMVTEFEASALEAGIDNARCVQAAWQDAEGIVGDVSLVVHVTYFVRDIVPFVEKLSKASRRRVIIGVSTVPPPNQGADLTSAIYGEPSVPVPSHQELLPVLWEMGLLPDVRVLASDAAISTSQAASPSGPGRLFSSRDEAVDTALAGRELEPAEEARAREHLLADFDQLFEPVKGGFRRRTGPEPRLMLITWQTWG